MERQFITPPTTEIYESCEERFNTIVEYLQECVDEDQMTVEEANEIANFAYDKYIVEARAVDKWLANREDKIKKARNSIENSSLLDKDKKKMLEELDKKKSAYGVDHARGHRMTDYYTDELLVGRKKGEAYKNYNPSDRSIKGNKYTIYKRGRDKKYYSEPVHPKKPGTILAAQNEKREYRKMIDDID